MFRTLFWQRIATKCMIYSMRSLVFGIIHDIHSMVGLHYLYVLYLFLYYGCQREHTSAPSLPGLRHLALHRFCTLCAGVGRRGYQAPTFRMRIWFCHIIQGVNTHCPYFSAFCIHSEPLAGASINTSARNVLVPSLNWKHLGRSDRHWSTGGFSSTFHPGLDGASRARLLPFGCSAGPQHGTREAMSNWRAQDGSWKHQPNLETLKYRLLVAAQRPIVFSSCMVL